MLALIEALRLYSDQDNLVTLFALIMRNEIDEEFAEIQTQIRLTVDDILQSLVEEKNSTKVHDFNFNTNFLWLQLLYYKIFFIYFFETN